MRYDEFAQLLDRPKLSDGTVTARCPAHDDNDPSLTVSEGDDGRVLLHCHAGCDIADILSAMGLEMSDLFDKPKTNGDSRPDITSTYPYTDAEGDLLFEVVRMVPKTFRQRRPNDNGGWHWNLKGIDSRPLWKLPEVLAAVASDTNHVWITEGEKDAAALEEHLPPGQVATTIPGGAGKWRDEHTAALAGATVCIVQDNDPPGRRHAWAVHDALVDVGCSVEVLEPIGGKDAAEALANGTDWGDWPEATRPDDDQDLKVPGDPELHDDQEDDDEPEGVLADGHRGTDVGNSHRLAAAADGRIRFVHKWRKWIVYVDGRWQIDNGDALITEQAKLVAHNLFRYLANLTGAKREHMWKWANRSESAASVASMVKLARGIPGVLVDHDQLDTHPWLLNVRNGTIDLRTGQLGPHDPEHLLTCQAPVVYDPDATAPLWEECLERWQPDPAMRRYLQVVVGSAATGIPVEHLYVHVGSGANGKGKFHGAIAATLGPGFYVVPDKSLLVAQRHEQHATVRARLFGARMAVAAETEAGDRLDEARIKELTGGDLLEARRMHEDPWQFAPSWTLFLHTNNRPRIRGGDEGIWRRVRLIPWDVTIPAVERDEHLAAKLAAEDAGILNWIIEGARTFYRDGIVDTDIVAAATADYRNDEDHVGRFLAECCTVDSKAMVTASMLRSAYERWCDGLGEKPWSAQALGRELTSRGMDTQKVGKSRSRTWIGVELTEEILENIGGER